MTNEIQTASTTLKSTRIGDTLRIAKLTAQVEKLTAEKKQLADLVKRYNDNIEAELKTDAIMRIKEMGKYNDGELQKLGLEDLQLMEQTLSKSKGLDHIATSYKSIRAGSASSHKGRLTVGSLLGKSRKEILDSGGDF